MKSQGIINRAGELVPGLHLLGHPGGPVYFLDSPQPVLFDSGFVALAQDGGDIGRTIRRVKEIDWDPRTGFKQPLPAYMLNLEARVKLLAKEAGYVVSKNN